jgi:hypothetical protein
VKKLVEAVRAALTSRFTSPIVLGLFLLVYVVIAFGTDDALTALIALTSQSRLLQLLLALLPLCALFRLFEAARREFVRGRLISGTRAAEPDGLFDESVSLPGGGSFERLKERLDDEGYRTVARDGLLSARRGASCMLPRLLFLGAICCLFAGILISITSRTTHRAPVVEGEPFPTATGGGGLVSHIGLLNGTGAVLSRVLDIRIEATETGEPAQRFGLYPPALHRGNFVYPRYLGFSPIIRFSAPELPAPFQGPVPLSLYPAGKEDSAEITGSPYRLVFSVEPLPDGRDPFQVGTASFRFKVLKGDQLLETGSTPVGGQFARNGFQLSVLESRRMVLTDFVHDYGVLLIWGALLLFGAALLLWLPLRTLSPRREMLFLAGEDGINAFSRVEGRRTRHGGVFHEALDLLEEQASATAERRGGQGQ